MTTSPRLGLPELAAGQAVPETTVNEENRYLEQGASYFIAKDRDLTAPPGSPADGDCYIVAASPTGAWSGKAKSLAFYLNTAWAFVTPIEGTLFPKQIENEKIEKIGQNIKYDISMLLQYGVQVRGTLFDTMIAHFLINPGNSNEWATAFYYCKQDCSTPATSWCAYSQGYWFNNPPVTWCQNVKFGNLEVNKQDGNSLWPPQNNLVKRAFFQASAIQLSLNCVNSGNSIPTSIVSDYNRVETFLSTLTYANLQNGTFPVSTDTTGVRAATGNIGRWICNNHCTTYPDPTACTGF